VTQEGKASSAQNRQKALDAARQEIEDARKALAQAERNLERLGEKPKDNFMADIKRMR
jgi:predicted  nucleic acid-binding Zn-ribbon protein